MSARNRPTSTQHAGRYTKHLPAFRQSGPVRRGVPPASAAAVVVAAHGRDQSPDYLIEHLVGRVEAHPHGRDVAAGLSWILPVASGNTWYPYGFMAPIEDNQPDLDDALAVLAAIEEELDGIDPRRVVWAGYSQGAVLVVEHIARRPARWGGLVALTGGMAGPPAHELTIAGDLGGLPAYFSNGDADEWVPLWRTEETADRYRAAGAEVTLDVFPGREHEIGDAEIDRTVALLAAITSTSH